MDRCASGAGKYGKPSQQHDGLLADLDRIYVDAAVNAEQINRIDSVREEVIAMVAAEDKIIDSLLARLN